MQISYILCAVVWSHDGTVTNSHIYNYDICHYRQRRFIYFFNRELCRRCLEQGNASNFLKFISKQMCLRN